MSFIWICILVATMALFYFMVLRRILVRVWPSLYGEIDLVGAPLNDRLRGLRTFVAARLHTFLGVVAVEVIGAVQFAQPILENSGWNWKDLIPQQYAFWAIPLILLASGVIFEKLRKITNEPMPSKEE